MEKFRSFPPKKEFSHFKTAISVVVDLPRHFVPFSATFICGYSNVFRPIPSQQRAAAQIFYRVPRGGGDFDLESGASIRKPRKPTSPSSFPLHSIKMMIRSFGNRIHYFYKIHPLLALMCSSSFRVAVLMILSYQSVSRGIGVLLATATTLVRAKVLGMVAGHSIYISRNCDKGEEEVPWFLEPYQRNPGQEATFVDHIRVGIEAVSSDDKALLLFTVARLGRTLALAVRHGVIGLLPSLEGGLVSI